MRFFILFLSVFLYAKYYSIEIYRSGSLERVKQYLESMSRFKRRFCFIYSDKGYSLRCLVSKSREKLKKSGFKGKIAEDKFENVKNYLNLTPRAFKAADTFYESVPLYVRMDVFLSEYNTQKIRDLIPVVEDYQKVEGYGKTGDYKKAQSVLFRMKNINSQSYSSYLYFFTVTGNYAEGGADYKSGYLYSFLNVKNGKNYFSFVDISSEAEIGYIKFNDFLIGAVKDKKSELSVGIERKIDNTTLFLGHNIADKDSLLKEDNQIYITKRDILSLKASFSKGRHTYQLLSSFSKDRLYIYRFDRYLLEGDYKFKAHSNLFYTSSLKTTFYSNYLQSSKEVGFGVLYGVMDNYSKKVKGFVNPSFVFNDKSGLGYGVVAGIVKRVIKADKLSFVINYTNSSREIKLSYRYYF